MGLFSYSFEIYCKGLAFINQLNLPDRFFSSFRGNYIKEYQTLMKVK